ncbi:hypothetical protein D3C87_1762300 [compost metagenome]
MGFVNRAGIPLTQVRKLALQFEEGLPVLDPFEILDQLAVVLTVGRQGNPVLLAVDVFDHGLTDFQRSPLREVDGLGVRLDREDGDFVFD